VSNEPEPVATLGRWKLSRWCYDGAPLMASRECGEVHVCVDEDGALDCEFTDARCALWIPADVLAALLKDYEERKSKR
jgi:hypothetical protein